MTSGIRTTYEYSNFRSRLEARWAAMFDLLGWRWTYEPLDAEGYIPDFLIHGDRPLFIEVGPCIVRADYEAKAAKPTAVAAELGHDVLVVGVSPLPGLSEGLDGGLLGEWGMPAPADPDQIGAQWWAAGIWYRCRACQQIAMHHAFSDYAGRPCGHYDGDRLLGDVGYLEIDHLWREAGNAVQWRKSA